MKPKRQRPGRVPIRIQLEVAWRQAGWETAKTIASYCGRGPVAEAQLESILGVLARNYRCTRRDLRLDHDPLLRVRSYNPRLKNVAARYMPHAHDPDCLRWRPQGAEFEQSHHVKTYVRGDRGQYSDVALANRERRREREAAGKRRRAAKIPARKNAWPPKGSRKLKGGSRWRKT